MIKEIPILFSTPMVQAELDDRKTMTRRTTDLESINENPNDWEFVRFEDNVKVGLSAVFKRKDSILHTSIPCRYGRPGDLLWVRETWSPDLAGNGEDGYKEYIKYAADGSRLPIPWVKDYDKYRNRPGIHMNKEYARIWLQVTDVRVERLKDISDSDAIAEGIESYIRIADIIAYKNYSEFARKDFLNVSSYGFEGEIQSAPVASFCTLWMEINGRESWISNPWVWVVSFKVLSTTGKPGLNNQ